MSIEPTCEFCGLVDKTRCRSQEQAEDCLQPLFATVEVDQKQIVNNADRQQQGGIEQQIFDQLG